MFYYDHGMARDDVYDEPEHSEKELDMVDGLRAMAMFKRDPGPLSPTDVNQDVKHALVTHPECIMELADDGFISDSLIRELEQMMSDMHGSMDKDMSQSLPSTFVMIVGGTPMKYGAHSMDEVGNPGKKKSKSRVNEAGNYTKPTMRKRQFQRIKAGGKGGKPGQWSARKAQMLAAAYKKAGGGYRD
jgi:phage gp16-like protein